MASYLPIGTMVEVAGLMDPLLGSFYGATIVDSVFDDFYVVEYFNIVHAGSDNRVREFVISSRIRFPFHVLCPDNFFAGQAIEAWSNGGWWTGVITGSCTEEAIYHAYFPAIDRSIEINHDRLRPHFA